MKTFVAILLLGSAILRAQDADTTAIDEMIALDTAQVHIDSAVVAPVTQFIPRLGDISDGSRAIPVHLMPIYDEMGVRLLPSDSPQLPFSTKQSCMPCHTYEVIERGWHFNAADTTVNPGRPGHPWIYTDRTTGTQIPLSHRAWDGVWHPDSVGLTPFFFVQEFGRQFPGGGVGENDSSDADISTFMRWAVSGKLEINCLACHDADPQHDQTEYAKQVRNQNFRWAATATSSFATVTGYASKMPLSFDYYDGVGPRNWIDLPPRVQYNDDTFDVTNKLFFDIERKAPNDNCYFCHTTVHKGTYGKEKWHHDEDIHLTSGMNCTDCHRNGMDHMIVRGYESEARDTGNHEIHTLSCEGCHIESHDAKVPVHGRLSAPEPKHTGIPTIHFEKMSCTSCHAGPWPEKNAQLVQTAMAHGLGNHGTIKADSVMPYLQSPVFVKGQNGKIEPHHLLYPAFWGVKAGDDISPLALDVVKPIVETVIQADTLTDSLNQLIIQSGQWLNFTDDKLIAVLENIPVDSNQTAVYVSGGYVFASKDSAISKERHEAANPYSWAFGHDVRPAEQSLGAGKKCADCHSLGAALIAGKLEIPTMIASAKGETRSQLSFQKTGAFYSWLFAFTFYFRPFLKLLIVGCIILMAGVVLLYAFRGLEAVVKSGF